VRTAKILFSYPGCHFEIFVLSRKRDGPLKATNDYDYLSGITFLQSIPTDYIGLWAYYS
jgi:hypothetical protein